MSTVNTKVTLYTHRNTVIISETETNVILRSTLSVII